uniref:Uncharacterized protein n=1 Tax=Oikopleura dioica TaxID=34765 RepID=Q675Q7_OIKDI|nr:hypothetical protein 006-17 [Oikopleura dioica]
MAVDIICLIWYCVRRKRRTQIRRISPSFFDPPSKRNSPIWLDEGFGDRHVTLVKADPYKSEKFEQRHRSTNVLTMKHKEFDEFPEYIDAPRMYYSTPHLLDYSHSNGLHRPLSMRHIRFDEVDLYRPSSYNTKPSSPDVPSYIKKRQRRMERDRRARSLDFNPDDLEDIFFDAYGNEAA